MKGARAHVGAPRRWRSHHVLLLALAGACTQSLDLDGYTFQPGAGNGGSGGSGQLIDNLAGSSGNDGQSGSDTGAAGSGDIVDPDGGVPDGGSGDPDAGAGNDGGASGSTGSAGSSGSAGASGSSGAGGAGSGGAGGLAGAGGFAGGSGSAGSGGGSCSSGDVCVPAFPFGWDGPIAVSRGGSAACPTGYGTLQGDIYANLQPGAVTCGCETCEVDSASFECHLQMSDGNLFVPASWDGFEQGEECESPPLEDQLLTLVPVATCSARSTETRTVSTWGTTERTCGGAVTTGSCGGGTCYPGAGSFSVCIAQGGDHACPSGFGTRSIFYTNFSDTRSCAACSCELQNDQACQMVIDICDVGGQDNVPLHTYGEPNGATSVQLNSSDGDGVTIESWSAVDVGNCDAYPGTTTGAIAPTGPVTVCCL